MVIGELTIGAVCHGAVPYALLLVRRTRDRLARATLLPEIPSEEDVEVGLPGGVQQIIDRLTRVAVDQRDEGAIVLLRFSVGAWLAESAGALITVLYLVRSAPIAAAETAMMVVVIELVRRWTCAARGGERVIVGTNLWVGAGALAMLGNAVTVGQDQAVTMWFFCAVPLIAAHLASVRAATIWLALAVGAFFVQHALPVLVPVAQEFVPTSPDRLLAQLIMTLALFVFGASQRRTVNRQLEVIRHQAAELEVARDRALAASRAKSDFLANMSHELRTPLHGLVVALDLAENDAPPELLRARVRSAMTCAEQAGRLVDDILDISRIEAGGSTIERVVFSPRHLVREVVAVARPVAEQRGISLSANIAAEVPAQLRGDAQKIRQVCVNLLANAVKFTDEGEVEVSADWRRGSLVVDVRDTGIGIALEAHERIFEKFEQSDGSTTRRYGGTGLGLSICRQLVRAMGGVVDVVSVVGVGSTFRVEIPCEVADDDSAEGPLQPLLRLVGRPTEPEMRQGPAGGPLVLVVDDNPINAAVASDLLAEIGCRSAWAADGPSALDELRSRVDIGAVLLDSHLPGMHGHEVARRIRRDADLGGRDITIVGLTADVSTENLRDAPLAGIDRTIGKPARRVTVEAALRELGVLDPLFDVRPIERACGLLERLADAPPAVAADTVRQAYECVARSADDARALVDDLRRDPAGAALFERAHANLAPGLDFAAGVLAQAAPSPQDVALALDYLRRARAWLTV